MAGRKRSRRGREYWQAIVEGFEESGLSVAAYCRRRGIETPSFYAWRKKLDAGSFERKKANPFVPVRLVASSVSGGQVEVELGSGKTIRFPMGMEPKTAASWVVALER